MLETDKKFVYDFGEIGREGIDLVGSKGAYLSEMTRMGLPIPRGFTATTKAFNFPNRSLVPGVAEQVDEAVKRLEMKTGKKLGDTKNPLLVSVRSGATVSMPGMMETILNVGINDNIADANNSPFIWNVYDRFLNAYAVNVMDIHYLEKGKDHYRQFQSITDLEERVRRKKDWIRHHFNPVTQNPRDQLLYSVKAVFKSWNSSKAQNYREAEGIDASLGTAVNVQEMVFGNRDNNSLTSVFFTRNPSTGKKELFGSFIKKEQGDAIVEGNESKPISKLDPKIEQEFRRYAGILEYELGDMQEVEATVDSGEIYILQTRPGKRTARASLRILLDYFKEGKISEQELLMRLNPEMILSVNNAEIAQGQDLDLFGKGTPISPGIVSGNVAHDYDELVGLKDEGKRTVLVKRALTTSDIRSIGIADAILTKEGTGNTISHALVVARGKNKICVTGLEDLIDDDNDPNLYYDQEVTVDGNTGKVYHGHLKLIEGKTDSAAEDILNIIKKHNNPNFLLLARGVDEMSSSAKGIFYLSRIPVDEIHDLRAVVNGSESYLKSYREMQYEDFSKALERGKKFSPFVFGLIPQRSLELMLDDSGIVSSRRRFFASVAERYQEMNKEGDGEVVVQVGAQLTYKGYNVTVSGTCGGCGHVLISYSSGETEHANLVMGQRYKGNLPFGSFNISPFSEGAQQPEVKTDKSSEIKSIYDTQVSALKKAVAKSGREVPVFDYLPTIHFVNLNGTKYVIGSFKDYYTALIQQAQERVRNGN